MQYAPVRISRSSCEQLELPYHGTDMSSCHWGVTIVIKLITHQVHQTWKKFQRKR